MLTEFRALGVESGAVFVDGFGAGADMLLSTLGGKLLSFHRAPCDSFHESEFYRRLPCSISCGLLVMSDTTISVKKPKGMVTIPG